MVVKFNFYKLRQPYWIGHSLRLVFSAQNAIGNNCSDVICTKKFKFEGLKMS